jgi:prepilin-type N-terminal cleavage/methylation domain-containing protein
MQRGHLRARAAQSPEDGFTLIELMMVILIIAILIAVLMPTFLGARQRANDRAIQTDLRNALTAAKAVYVDDSTYNTTPTPLPGRLNAEGVPIKFVDGATSPAAAREISVDAVTDNYVILAGLSKSGTCFYVSDDEATGAGTQFSSIGGGSGSGGCPAISAPPVGDPSWQPNW